MLGYYHFCIFYVFDGICLFRAKTKISTGSFTYKNVRHSNERNTRTIKTTELKIHFAEQTFSENVVVFDPILSLCMIIFPVGGSRMSSSGLSNCLKFRGGGDKLGGFR